VSTKKYRRIVVKIGSNVLTCSDGTLDKERMSMLVDQIATIRRAGVQVIVVSSGAVASGRSELENTSRRLDAVSARQLYSAVGQVKLVNRYYQLFKDRDMVCGQVLTTKESLSTRQHYLNQRNCMQVMLDNGVIPIVNENDTIAVTELMFTDNDELSGMVSTMMGAELLIILSNVDGIFDGSPHDPHTQVIREIKPEKRDISTYVQTQQSQFGRGGMLTKGRIAAKVANEGIEVIIANGKRDNILTDLVLTDPKVICTRFLPAERPVAAVKKWIAHSDGFAKGELHINQGAYNALKGEKAVSLLPVGVERVEGEFEKDDIVRIVAPDGSTIGVGRIAVDSAKAQQMAEQKGGRALVHYDYLYLEK